MQVLLPHGDGIEKGRQGHKAQQLHQEPGPIAGEEVGPFIVDGEAHHFNEKVEGQHHGGAFGKPVGHAIVLGQIGGVHLVMQIAMRQRPFEDDHGQAGGDTGNKEEHREYRKNTTAGAVSKAQ